MNITSLSKNKTASRLQENIFADVHDGGGVSIRHVYGHTLVLDAEAEKRLLNTLLAAKAERDNAEPVVTVTRATAAHGSPFDRGYADSYYGRGKDPHFYPDGSYRGEKVTDLTPQQLAEYYAGYEDSQANFDFKDWG